MLVRSSVQYLKADVEPVTRKKIVKTIWNTSDAWRSWKPGRDNTKVQE